MLLEELRMRELLVMAKELQIRGRHELLKAELIAAIRDAQAAKPVPRFSEKPNYIENAKIDDIVAFKVNDAKALSGKIEEIHKEFFRVETKNGIKFKVFKSDIIWVKTGARWPRGVYLALKGDVANGDEIRATN